jgi:hypothetical protein
MTTGPANRPCCLMRLTARYRDVPDEPEPDEPVLPD